MIVVVSSPGDDHTPPVLERLRAAGAETHLVDLSLFPRDMRLSVGYRPGGRRSYVVANGHGGFDLADARVVWWRRPQPFALHPELRDDAHRSFAHTECYFAWAGVWSSLDAFWVNDALRDDQAARKVYQLRVAREVGFTIPETLITNDPEQARAFALAHGPETTVYKAFSGTVEAWRETRVLAPQEVDLLETVAFAPVIFQEYVAGSVDLRITVIDDRIFASAIHSQATGYKVDYRMEMDKTVVEPYALPDDVGTMIRAYMERLGLVYGAIDMRVTPDGRHVFFEINPSGQWLFMEERTGQPMTDAFADLLLAHN